MRSSENEERMAKQLLDAGVELHEVLEQKNELQLLLRQVKDQMKLRSYEVGLERDASPSLFGGPSGEYEAFRRRLKRDMDELGRFVESGLKGLEVDGNSALLNRTASEVKDRYHALVADFDSMTENDGYAGWRRKEAKALSDLVQRRLHALQNPKNCSAAKKLVCKLNKGCGYGCQIHHVVYCFIIAYGTERTLILKSKGWRYNKGGFEEVFKPLSDSCLDPKGSSHTLWPGHLDTQVVDIPIVDSINPRPRFLPPAIPADLAPRIVKVHGDPIVWWISEFLRYILRPQEATSAMLKEVEDGLHVDRPLVGIHIRRTDKVGTEAAFHPVEEYMKHVENYFSLLQTKMGEKRLGKRSVYVASDDIKVLAECRRKFPDYTFIGDQSIAKSAAVSSRYNLRSLRGVIADIHMLSLSDYLVCTFSSQVCRVAYEIQQQRFVDASGSFKSLDDIWYFGGQSDHQQEAIYAHAGAEQGPEIGMAVGDTIGVAGNHWNGFNKGRNYASNRIGLYPEYKTREKLRIVDFPTYPSVNETVIGEGRY